MSNLDRRQFLKRAGVAAGALALSRVAQPKLARAVGFPTVGPAGSLNTNLLVTPAQLQQWEEFMVGLGSRYTASVPHHQYIAFVQNYLDQLPSVSTTIDKPQGPFPRWEADFRNCTLGIAEAGGSFTNLDVMSYFPYSGNTSFLDGGALTAPLVDVGMGLPQDFAAGIATGSLKGKIGFLTMPRFRATAAAGYPNYYLDDPDHTMLPTQPWNTWALSILAPQALATPTLALQAGCAGLVIALEASTDCAIGQYISFLGAKLIGDQVNGATGLPILYVDYRTGELIRSRLSVIGSTTTARMSLPATIEPNATTPELIAVLPATQQTDEVVLITSHSDGISGSEENGPLGMLAIANYFAQKPERRRNLWFAFTGGHMCGYTTDTNWFLNNHPDIVSNAVATMAIEHLGQRSFTDTPETNTFSSDGYSEIGVSYVSQNPLLIESVTSCYATGGLQRAPVCNGPGFGVSIPLFSARLPCYAYITGPNALYQMDQQKVLEQFDNKRMFSEVRTFIRILETWEGMTAQDLGAGVSLTRGL
ncbi:MAG: twin-arginine translocation signal domain-containing protein [Actinomycetota bacterium]